MIADDTVIKRFSLDPLNPWPRAPSRSTGFVGDGPIFSMNQSDTQVLVTHRFIAAQVIAAAVILDDTVVDDVAAIG